MLISKIFQKLLYSYSELIQILSCCLLMNLMQWFLYDLTKIKKDLVEFYKCMQHEFFFLFITAYLKELMHMDKDTSFLDLKIKKKQFLKLHSGQIYLFRKLEPTLQNLVREIRSLSLLGVVRTQV